MPNSTVHYRNSTVKRAEKNTIVRNILNQEYYCDCGGILRPSIVLFGEALPQDAFQMAMEEAEKSDPHSSFSGSSLTVTPANQFPLFAKQNGAKLVIVNLDPTPLDMYADEVINGEKIGTVLKDWNKALQTQ